jgi:ketosteroid isomerase-like protein
MIHQNHFMTVLLRIVTALSFSLAVSSFAQQIVTAPGELSIPTPAEKPTPQPTATPKAVEKPSPKAARVPKKEATPPPAQKQVPEPSPVGNVAETVVLSAQARKTVEATLKEMENQWQAAIVAHDQAAVDSLVAPDFAGINPEGKFVNKSAIIAQVKNDKDTYATSKNEKLNVHIYGANVAVVTGSVRSKGTSKIGQAFDRAYRFTDTWMEREGKWQCVASQDSLLNP